MRRRRDSFGRCTYVPHVQKFGECRECGQHDRVYQITIENDSGRDAIVPGLYCSWDCAEAFNRTTFPK